jgi:hypothetical protein
MGNTFITLIPEDKTWPHRGYMTRPNSQLLSVNVLTDNLSMEVQRREEGEWEASWKKSSYLDR